MIDKKDLPIEITVDRLDQTVFQLNDEQMQEFISTLDKPAVDNLKLDKLMTIVPPWKKLK